MTRYILLLIAGVVTSFALILGCGGRSDIIGETFPLTASITVDGVNNDAMNVHILIAGEGFDPAVNRVSPGATLSRMTPLSYTWDNSADTVTLTIQAGRSGAIIDTKTITMTGDQRMDSRKVRAVFNADQTLTLTIPPRF